MNPIKRYLVELLATSLGAAARTVADDVVGTIAKELYAASEAAEPWERLPDALKGPWLDAARCASKATVRRVTQALAKGRARR